MQTKIGQRLNGPLSKIDVCAMVEAVIPNSIFQGAATDVNQVPCFAFEHKAGNRFLVSKKITLKELGEYLFKKVIEEGIELGIKQNQVHFQQALGVYGLLPV